MVTEARDPIVYLNGEFLPLSQARISVLDRGFLFGDGVYEVIPVYGGKPFRIDQHLDRLDHSLAGIRLQSPLGHDQWKELVGKMIQGRQDQSIYLQVTRGVVAKRDHAFPEHARPTVFVMVTSIDVSHPKPARAITCEDIRWRWCHIKAITLLANVLLRQDAIDQGCQEAILVRDGKVTEGAASNIFVVHGGVLRTPPKGPDLLPGITRDLVLELAIKNDIPASESDCPADMLTDADEIWFTSSTRELVPVIELNNRPVGHGRPGPLWEKLYGIFQQYKKEFRAT